MACLKILTIFALLTIVFFVTESCKIEVRVRSDTSKEFRLQIFIPSIKQKTEQITFNGKGQKQVHIKGENCMHKKWVVRTWKPDGKGGWLNAKQGQARIDGNGWFRITVGDDFNPTIYDRMGVFCSEGQLCG